MILTSQKHMAIKIAINGFGRIGRTVAKTLFERYPNEIEIVAVNDLTDAPTLAHLFQYDSTFGIYHEKVTAEGSNLHIGSKQILVTAEKDPSMLPWGKLDVDVVLECTGRFTSTKDCEAHLQAGAKKVVISAPAKDDTHVFVLGVNEKEYDPNLKIVSNASCTTNCLAPLVKVLNDAFTIRHGFMSTVHSYTADQMLQDAPHKDLRRARTAGVSIVPTTTGAAKTVSKVIPSLEGKLDGISYRVPTNDVSIVDFTCEVEKPVESAEALNQLFLNIAAQEMKGVLDVSDLPLVSIDFRHNAFSAILDSMSTMVIDGNFVKVVAWYDNEWGYSSRLADMAVYISKK